MLKKAKNFFFDLRNVELQVMSSGYCSDSAHPWGVGRWHWNSGARVGWGWRLRIVQGVNGSLREKLESWNTCCEGRNEGEETEPKRKLSKKASRIGCSRDHIVRFTHISFFTMDPCDGLVKAMDPFLNNAFE